MRWFGWLRWRRTAVAESEAGALPVAMVAGRLRTRGIPYVMPRDLEEINRLDFQHYLLRSVFSGNYLAPLEAPASILDVGAGTGRWAREMAAQFPLANVIGLDVNAPAADEAAQSGGGADPRPDNYSFVPGNILEGLPFADGSFDFVHMRLLVSAIPHDRWPFVVRELARVTRAGGWVESVETTLMEGGGEAMDQIIAWGNPVLALRGIQMADGAAVGERLRAAGLANVTAQRVDLPCGSYGGRIGRMVAADYLAGAKAFGGLVAAQGLATPEQVQQVLARAEADLAAPDVRCVAPVYIAYGQRVH